MMTEDYRIVIAGELDSLAFELEEFLDDPVSDDWDRGWRAAMKYAAQQARGRAQRLRNDVEGAGA